MIEAKIEELLLLCGSGHGPRRDSHPTATGHGELNVHEDEEHFEATGLTHRPTERFAVFDT